MIHELKIKPEYFAAVVSGDKTFEIRNNADRNFQVGDTLSLKAWDGEFTGQTVERTVSYITDFEQKQGYVVLGLQKQHGTPAADWREAGEHDPFGDRYNCARDELPMGNVTDDALANQLFVCDHRHDMQSITLLTAGKERIRWLSRQLESRKQHEHELLANHRKMLIEKSELCDDLLDLIERMVNCMGLAGEEPEKDSYNPMKAWMYDAIATMAGQRPKQSVAVTETIRTAPERIWLQVGDQSHYHSEPFPEHHDEVTWCADSVVACEVPYVRADLAGKVPEQHKTNWPDKCPITRRDFFMEIDGVPTYGGPYDSYTIPEMLGTPEQPWHERELFVRRFDHDEGRWVDDEVISQRVIHDGVLDELLDLKEQQADQSGVAPQGGEPCAIVNQSSSPA